MNRLASLGSLLVIAALSCGCHGGSAADAGARDMATPVDLAWQTPSGDKSTVSASGNDVTADGESQATITVTVIDVNGNPIPYAVVTLTATGDGNLITEPGNSDQNGVAHGAVASTVAGDKVVSVSVDSGTGNVALSQQVTVTFVAGPAAKLAFVTPPMNGTAGQPLPEVQVAVEDKTGNVVGAGTSTVSLTLANDANGAKLEGTTSVQAFAGVATFSALEIDRAGMGYALTAAASGLPLTTSVAFDVMAANNANADLATAASMPDMGAGDL